MAKNKKEVKLNKGQRKGAKKIMDWARRPYKQLFEVTGGPGTGKTTMLMEALSPIWDIETEIIFVAYQGKATNVMRMNGLPAKTIHSTIYRFVKERMYDGEGRLMRRPDGKPMIKPKFELVGYISKKIKCIVIDEAGQVPDEILDDILSYGVPVIAVGDKDQLPPVFGKSRLFKEPDVILTQIMRQAKGSAIIELAQAILKGKPLYQGKWGKGVYVLDESYLTKKSIYKKADIIICGKNTTRDNINEFVRREIHGRESEYPVVGDKMVCRKNNWNLFADDDIPLTNGTVGTVTYIDKSKFNMKTMVIDFLGEDMTECFYDIPMDNSYLFATSKDRKDKSYYGNGNLMEYAYALTCNLAQGSQYDNVVVIVERLGGGDEYFKKWLYTAVTRAKKNLIVIMPNSEVIRPRKLFRKKQ